MQQHATTCNRAVQTDATCNIQQCWELLATNVASFCTGLYILSNDYDDMIYTLLLTNVNMYIVFVTPFMIVRDQRSKIGRRK